MNIKLLQQLCEASAVSGDEQEVRAILIKDYDALFTLVRELLTSLTAEQIKTFTDFRRVI